MRLLKDFNLTEGLVILRVRFILKGMVFEIVKTGSYYDNLTIDIVDLDKLYHTVSKSPTRVTTQKNCWR